MSAGFPREMRLTRSGAPSCPDDGFPTSQFFIISLCRLAEPIAITSIFPYAWLMVQRFHIGSEHDDSFYCGILIASFSLAESVSSMWWGSLSDRVGRKPVLLLGCFGTMLSLLIVGFAPNFTIALVGRILGGLLNGNIGVIQTMVGELVTNPDHEPKAYSIMPFVWSVGTIAGPALGGLLAQPARAYPDLFSKHGFFGRFPWALPNLVCAALLLVSIVASYFYLQETHPDFKPNAEPFVHHDIPEQTPMIAAAGASVDPGVDLRQDSYGTFNEINVGNKDKWRLNADGTSRPPSLNEKFPVNSKWFTRQVAMLTLALGIFSYHCMCYDHLLPIFFQDDRADDVTIFSTNIFHIPGGLGLSTKQVGLIMAVNGLIALFVQAVVFPLAAKRLGVWRVFVVVTILHPIAYVIVPYLALLPDGLLYPGIYVCLAIHNLLTILAYPVILILLKQASVSPSFLGRINGLAASAGAGCRTVAPPVAGMLYSWGLDIGFTGLAYLSTAAVALAGVAQLFFVPRDKNDNSNVKSLIVPGLTGGEQDKMYDVVDITVVDSEEEV